MPREWPARPEAGERAVDETVVLAAKRGGVQAELAGEARPEALYEHVCSGRQAAHDPRTAPQVDRDGALVGVRRQEHRARPLEGRRAPRARLVAGARRLDLDHLGAERAEHLGAERPGVRRRHVDDPNAVERRELAQGVSPVRIRARIAGSMFPPETMQTTF